MAKETTTKQNGIGFMSLLGLTFIILKLCGVITWSWWWVTLPFWGGLALLLVVLLVIGIIAVITHAAR